MNIQMIKLDLEKAEKSDIKLPTPIGLSKKQESSRKTSTSALLTMPKPLSVWIKINYGKFLKRWDYQTTWHVGQETTVRTGHGTTDCFQIRKGVHQGCILSLCLFNLYAEYITWNARLDEAQAESRLPGEISVISDMQMTPPLWHRVKRTKELLDESDRGEWKSWLKTEYPGN